MRSTGMSLQKALVIAMSLGLCPGCREVILMQGLS